MMRMLWELLPLRLEYGHQTGDYDAVMSLIHRIADEWYHFQYPHLCEDDRLDIVQDACLRFFNRIHSVKPDTCNRYLIRLLKSNYIDYTRRKQRQHRRETPLETHEFHLSQSPNDWVETAIGETDIRAMLSDDEHALYQAVQAGYSLREYAQQARITLARAMQLARTVREKLHLYWEDNDDN